jgi:5-methylcytosine-specific restriction endonuclease McrA
VYKWRDSHKEQHREYNKAWKVANKERQYDLAKKWRAEHPENVQRAVKKWQDANRDRLHENNARWHATHPDEARERRKRWRGENPEREKIHKHTRRTRISESGGSFTVSDIQNMLKQQKGKCIVCLTSIKENYHIDHVIPVSKGGSSDRSNLQLLCPRCNMSKHDRDNITFMQQNGYLL